MGSGFLLVRIWLELRYLSLVIVLDLNLTVYDSVMASSCSRNHIKNITKSRFFPWFEENDSSLESSNKRSIFFIEQRIIFIWYFFLHILLCEIHSFNFDLSYFSSKFIHLGKCDCLVIFLRIIDFISNISDVFIWKPIPHEPPSHEIIEFFFIRSLLGAFLWEMSGNTPIALIVDDSFSLILVSTNSTPARTLKGSLKKEIPWFFSFLRKKNTFALQSLHFV